MNEPKMPELPLLWNHKIAFPRSDFLDAKNVLEHHEAWHRYATRLESRIAELERDRAEWTSALRPDHYRAALQEIANAARYTPDGHLDPYKLALIASDALGETL